MLLLGATAAVWIASRILPPHLGEWVAGPDFNRLLSQAVSKALKVDGTFGPMTLGPDLSVTTEGFASKGWPGQAIGGLDAGRATGWFNPWAVLRRRWQVDLIQIDSAEFRLVPPNDALKSEDPAVPSRPWYAFLMPSQFFCRWIECPDLSISLPLGAQTTVRGTGLSVGAMMIGRNFKYFGRNGVLHYPELPDMAVDAVEVYVTREMIDIGYLYLREPSSPRSNIKLSTRLGQHADKSINASAGIMSLDIRPFLPVDVAKILSGRLQGSLTYETDTSGGNASGRGSLSLDGAALHNWDYLDAIAERSGQPGLAQINFQTVSLDYDLKDDVFHVGNLVVQGREQIDLRGGGTWSIADSEATLSITASRIPLGAYLPPDIAGHMTGELAGEIDWAWTGTAIEHGHGGGTLRVTDSRLQGFKFQEFLDRFLKNGNYSTINVGEASCAWQQDKNRLRIDNLNVIAPGQAGLRGWAEVTPDRGLRGTILAGLPASSLQWLPDATTSVFARHEDGLYWCSIELSGTVDKPKTDFTTQVMRQLEKHPAALAELALRGLSWWLGDILGTHPRQRP